MNEVTNYKELNAYLAKFAIKGDIKIDVRKTPWCAAQMNAWERAAGNPGITVNALAARYFISYGDPIKLEDAKVGDIVVFARGHNGNLGHVAYFLDVVGHGENRVIMHLGGNQWNIHRGASDEINIGATPLTRLLAIRRK